MSLARKDKDRRKVRYQSTISLSTSTSSLSSRSRSRSRAHKVCKVTKNLSSSTRCQRGENSASARLPQIISHNLISLINQFENLDNVSASTTIARISSSNRSREFSRKQKKNQITDRCDGSPDLEISNRVEETRGKSPRDNPSQYDNTLVYSNSLKPQFKVNSDLDVEKGQTQQSNSNFVDEETVRKDCQSCRRRLNLTSAASTQIVANDNNRVVSMQEKIKFFDGSASAIANNKSRFCEITQVKSKPVEVQESRDINEKNNLDVWQKQVKTQTSCMDPSKIISDKKPNKRSSVFDSKITNQLSTKKRSPNNCNFNISTDFASIPERRKGKVALKSMYSEKNRNSPVCSADFKNKLKIKDLGQDVGEGQKLKHGSLNTKLNMKKLSRKPSNKIEALFRQSVDQTHDTSENNQNHMNESYISPKIKLKFHKGEDQNNQMVSQEELNAKKEAKFLSIRKKFEIKILPEESIKKDNYVSDKQDSSSLQSSKQDKKLSRGLIDRLPTYSSESLLKRYKNTKTELVSPEVAEKFVIAETPLVTSSMKKTGITQENSQKKISTSSSTLFRDKVVQSNPINTQKPDFYLPKRMAPVASSGLVGEKVKQFENIKSLRVSGAFPTRRSITRRLNRSLRGFFEYWGSHEKMRGKNESSSVDELEDFCEEFQCIDTQRKKSKGILNFNIASSKNPPKATNINEYPEKSFDSSSPDEMDVWIIKKVNCGLKQPKPLRAVEIKSMVLLCSSFSSGSGVR
ncbi:hypothetical protein OnM2_064056 [Erysiphe neolycopersici]|uniref:Uncharacterized protein n=1 Tax=Erysiphe neolycopersici TaxID=212602 RepID=A0A420HN41_9PEZI|nr:hypothetical protein OnM2_064056 [Erysiphe neolycopersici]